MASHRLHLGRAVVRPSLAVRAGAPDSCRALSRPRRRTARCVSHGPARARSGRVAAATFGGLSYRDDAASHALPPSASSPVQRHAVGSLSEARNLAVTPAPKRAPTRWAAARALLDRALLPRNADALRAPMANRVWPCVPAGSLAARPDRQRGNPRVPERRTPSGRLFRSGRACRVGGSDPRALVLSDTAAIGGRGERSPCDRRAHPCGLRRRTTGNRGRHHGDACWSVLGAVVAL